MHTLPPDLFYQYLPCFFRVFLLNVFVLFHLVNRERIKNVHFYYVEIHSVGFSIIIYRHE